MSLIHLKTNQSGTIAEKEEALLQAKVEELNSGYDRLVLKSADTVAKLGLLAVEKKITKSGTGLGNLRI